MSVSKISQPNTDHMKIFLLEEFDWLPEKFKKSHNISHKFKTSSCLFTVSDLPH